MNKKSPIIAIFLFVVHLTIPVLLSAQEKKSSPSTDINKLVPLFKVSNQDGWKIPPVNKKELFSNEKIGVQSVSVTVKGYKLRKWLNTNLDLYFLNADNSLIIYSKNIEIKSLVSYSVGEKTFAYQIIASPPSVGVLIRVLYFDEDGDGKFETRYLTNKPLDEIRAWVTRTK